MRALVLTCSSCSEKTHSWGPLMRAEAHVTSPVFALAASSGASAETPYAAACCWATEMARLMPLAHCEKTRQSSHWKERLARVSCSSGMPCAALPSPLRGLACCKARVLSLCLRASQSPCLAAQASAHLLARSAQTLHLLGSGDRGREFAAGDIPDAHFGEDGEPEVMKVCCRGKQGTDKLGVRRKACRRYASLMQVRQRCPVCVFAARHVRPRAGTQRRKFYGWDGFLTDIMSYDLFCSEENNKQS